MSKPIDAAFRDSTSSKIQQADYVFAISESRSEIEPTKIEILKNRSGMTQASAEEMLEYAKMKKLIDSNPAVRKAFDNFMTIANLAS